MKLKDRVAIVTGSGRGIGRAIALAVAEQGADVVVAARTLAELEATAAKIRSLGRRALIVQADVSCRRDVEAMVDAALAEFGRIDILVNNAGVQPPVGPLWENDPNEWLRTIQINLGGVFLCCRTVVPVMIRQGGGKIINLSGGGAAGPRASFSAYAASKAAIVRLTETLAEEVKGFGIQVNVIAPGAVNTRLTDEILAAGAAAGDETLARAHRQKKSGGVPPEKAAALAVFLASDESDGLTGRLISAVWDDWQSMSGRIDQIMTSDLYTLRRVTESKR
jgi:NAD(P)-dependent dehydrogenase (short-subunit alcohol dehydrogenase family)